MTPTDWTEIRSPADLPSDGFVVITDDANDDKVHGAACPHVQAENLASKLGTGNGRYYKVPSLASAEAGGARKCRSSSDPINR